MTTPQTKLCSCCQRDLPLSEFGNNRQTPDGLMYYCKPCAAEKQRIFRKTNPAAAKAAKERYLVKVRLRNDAARKAAQ